MRLRALRAATHLYTGRIVGTQQYMRFPILSAEEAAALIAHEETVGMSGFTSAGSVKVVPGAIARRAAAEHAVGRPFQIKLMTGASTGQQVDGPLAEAGAVSLRVPYQSDATMRAAINSGEVAYMDMHLSAVAQAMRLGFLPRVTTAIIEVCDVTDEGELTLTTSMGNSAAYCRMADRIILELNSYHKPELREIHDIYELPPPPHRGPIPITEPEDRIGQRTLKVDPRKIVAVVRTHQPDNHSPYKACSPETDRIGEHIVRFLKAELQAGRLSAESSLLLQSGVGNIANATLAALGRSDDMPPIKMYSEVIQDAVIELMKNGRCLFASGCSLSVSDEVMQDIYAHFEFFRERIVLRPQEVSNSPEVGHRLGVVSMNAALEVDLFGNVNSTHVCGNRLMNGVGGSGDYARSAALTIFMCPSVAKGGCISSIVPMVSHTDHPEHDVDVVVTEQGVADLRGKSPRERAAAIIEHCAHPDYKELLRRYIALTPTGHTPHCLEKAFAFHLAFQHTGDMHNASL